MYQLLLAAAAQESPARPTHHGRLSSSGEAAPAGAAALPLPLLSVAAIWSTLTCSDGCLGPSASLAPPRQREADRQGKGDRDTHRLGSSRRRRRLGRVEHALHQREVVVVCELAAVGHGHILEAGHLAGDRGRGTCWAGGLRGARRRRLRGRRERGRVGRAEGMRLGGSEGELGRGELRPTRASSDLRAGRLTRVRAAGRAPRQASHEAQAGGDGYALTSGRSKDVLAAC